MRWGAAVNGSLLIMTRGLMRSVAAARRRSAMKRAGSTAATISADFICAPCASVVPRRPANLCVKP